MKTGTFAQMQEEFSNGAYDLTDNGKCTQCGNCCSNLLPMTAEEIATIHKYIKKHNIKEHKHILPLAEQTLDDLSFVFIETVNKLKPKTVIMENVEGLLLGNAWSYVQEIYKQFKDIGYKLHHWLLKGETMGVPQKRHRVFFVAIREGLNIDPANLDMSFNYEPITYSQIYDGKGRKCDVDSKTYKLLCECRDEENDLGAAHLRLFGSKCFFQNKILKQNEVVMTIRAKSNDFWSKENKAGMSCGEIISSQTFPQDYDFETFTLSNITYICGMSVPPLMIKRIVTKLIEQGVYDYKLKELSE